MKNSFVSGLVLSLICMNLALAETVYIKARQAKLYVEPSAKAELVTSAQKGDAVEIIEQQGRWLKVSFDQHHGWVSSMLVGKTPPGDKVTVLDDDASLEADLDERALDDDLCREVPDRRPGRRLRPDRQEGNSQADSRRRAGVPDA
jgi:hypothetical protein